jgi:hypothetical protein
VHAPARIDNIAEDVRPAPRQMHGLRDDDFSPIAAQGLMSTLSASRSFIAR